MSQDLIKRLEAAMGPDRELDAEVHKALVGEVWSAPIGGHWLMDGSALIPAYTSSIDAAVALAERVLPGWRVENLCEWEDEVLRSRGPWTCDLRKNGTNFFSPLKGKCSHAPSAALALCIAILKAKEAISASPLAPEGGEG